MPPNSAYEIFQNALAEARQRSGATQADVASALGKPQSFVSKYESGERRLDVIEFLQVCGALSLDPRDVLGKLNPHHEYTKSLFHRWNITEKDLTELVDQNPSLRGVLLGYVAEKKFHDMFLQHPDISATTKDDDHNRKAKGDQRILYKGASLMIEVKSLQTNMVRQTGPDEWVGKTQVDASDRRDVKLSDGSRLNTTLLMRGEFDLLAVNCFAFGQKWRFAFAKNADLPRSTFRSYTAEQRKQLIASLIPVTWPPQPPFTDDLYPLLDDLAAHKPTS